MDKAHTVRSYDEELDQLKSMIEELTKASEWQIAKAVKALSSQDERLAEETFKSDDQVDALTDGIEDFVMKMLAKRQPVAKDLRNIVSCLRIAANLERVSDFAAKIAKYTQRIDQAPSEQEMEYILLMTKKERQMLNDILEAYLKSDEKKAIEVWHADDEIDQLYADILSHIRSKMANKEASVDIGTTLMSIAKSCERIGDHICNIAENVYYVITGEKYRGDKI